ncbi:MAG: helix-turn-helix transcriptional regulator [Clostridia bacterium]|nr:helix-turn-helix transcriptional regulator [Clostridia bacterium]
MDYIDKLTALREDHDISQTQVAEILGISQTAVSKYELRQRKYQVQDIIKLCEYYGVSSDYLLDLPTDLKDPRR